MLIQYHSSSSFLLSKLYFVLSFSLLSLLIVLILSSLSITTFAESASTTITNNPSSRIDISSLPNFINQSLTTSEPIVTFFGTITENKHFLFKNVLVPESTTSSTTSLQVFFDITMSPNNATLEISNTSFPSSLRIVVDLIDGSTSTTSAMIKLNNIEAKCSTSNVAQKCTPGSEGGKLIVHQEQENNNNNYYDYYAPTFFAALVEIKQLSSSTRKSLAPSISIISENSKYEIVDDKLVNDTSSLVSFGIQRFHPQDQSLSSSSSFDKFSLGAGISKTAPSFQHMTILPFVNTHFSSSSFVCESDRSNMFPQRITKTTPHGPRFVGCLVIGNNFNQDLALEKMNQRALGFSQDFNMERSPPTHIREDVPFYAQPAGFDVQLLVDSVWVSDSCSFKGSCVGGLMCQAISLSQVIFQKVLVEDSIIEMKPCYASCGGIVLGHSYGDNFTSHSSTASSTSSEFLNRSFVENTEPPSILLPSSSSTSSSTNKTTTARISSSYFVVINLTAQLGQTPDPSIACEEVPLTYIPAIVISATDIAMILIKKIKVTTQVTHSKHSLLAVGYLVRSEYFTVDDVSYHGSFYGYDDDYYKGTDLSTAVINMRFAEFVKKVKYINFHDIDVISIGFDQAVIGQYSLRPFDYLIIENWSNISVKTVNLTRNVVVWNFAYLENVKYGVLIRNVTGIVLHGERNGLMLYFDDSLIRNFGTGIFIENVHNVSVRVRASANFVMSNSTFVHVPIFSIRNISYSGYNIMTDEDGGFVVPTLGKTGSVAALTLPLWGMAELISIDTAKILFDGAVAMPFNLLTPTQPLHGITKSTFVARNFDVSMRSSSASSVVFSSVNVPVEDSYGFDLLGLEDSIPTLIPLPPVTVIDSKFKFENSPFMSSVAMGALTRTELLTFRNVEIINVKTFFRPMITSTGAIGTVDVSSDSLLSRDIKNNDVIRNVLNAPGCSKINGEFLFGRDTILETFTSAEKPSTIIARYCGDDLTRTQSHSQTFYIPWKRTRTETNFSKTKTATKTKSFTDSKTEIPLGLDLQAPRGPVAVSTIAAAASALGASGASVALDGARAVAILTLIAQCNSFEKRAADMSGLSETERAEEFQNYYLHMQLGFPENPLPFVCFGDERGACIRGSMVSNLLVILIAFFGAWGIYGRIMYYRAAKSLTAQQKLTATFFQFSRIPNIIGLVFSYLVGTWSTNSIVLLLIPGLPDGDAFIAVISLLLFISLFWYCLTTIWKNVNVEETGKNHHHNFSKKKTFDRWICEESMLTFDKAFRGGSSSSRNNKKSSSSSSSASSCFQSIISRMGKFLQSPYGRYIGIGSLVWIERSKEELERLEKEYNSRKNKGKSRVAASSFDDLVQGLQSSHHHRSINSRTGMVFGDDDDDEEMIERRSTPFLLASNNNTNNQRQPDDDDDDDLLLGTDAFSHRLRKYKNCDRRKKKLQQKQQLQQKEEKNKPSSSSSFSSSRIVTTPMFTSSSNSNDSINGTDVLSSNADTLMIESSKNIQHNSNKKKSNKIINIESNKDKKTSTSANGTAGTLLWNFGSLVNKHVGPHTRDQPLTTSSTSTQKNRDDKSNNKSIRTKKNNAGNPNNSKYSITNKNNNNNNNTRYELTHLGGVATRRYFYNDYRLRIAPYYALISLTWTMMTTMAQGVAIANPNSCNAIIIVMAIINVLSFFTDLWIRPYIVPFRNHAIIFAGLFLMTASIMAVSVDKETMQDDNNQIPKIVNAFVMTFLFVLMSVSILIVVLAKGVMILGGGTLLVRKDVVKQLNAMFAEAEENLMEKVLVERLSKNGNHLKNKNNNIRRGNDPTGFFQTML